MDRQDFLKTLAEACHKTDWQVHDEGNHSAEVRQESALAKAERIVAQELARRGWTEADLDRRRKNDPGKLEIAARLRKETILSLKSIAARVPLGTSKGASATLHSWMRGAGEKAVDSDETNQGMAQNDNIPRHTMA